MEAIVERQESGRVGDYRYLGTPIRPHLINIYCHIDLRRHQNPSSPLDWPVSLSPSYLKVKIDTGEE